MMSLSRRFSTVFIALVAIPVLSVCILLSQLYMDALLSVVSQQARDTLARIHDTIRGEIDNVSILASALINDQNLHNDVNEYVHSPQSPAKQTLGYQIVGRLDNFFYYTNRIGAVVLYLKDGTIFSSSNYYNSSDLNDVGLEAIAESKHNPGTVVLVDSLKGVHEREPERVLISIVVSPARADGPNEIEAALITLGSTFLQQFLNTPSKSPSSMAVVDDSDHVLLSNLPPDLQGSLVGAFGGPYESGFGEILLGDKVYLNSVQEVVPWNWRLHLLLDRTALTQRITSYQWYAYPGLAILLGLFVLYALVFFSRVTQPIHTVIEHMALFATGKETVVPHTEGIRELANLAQGFNRMVGEIQSLNRERDIREHARLSAELEALRYQINPHFIANTLNAIRFMAISANAVAIRDMTQALMKILADSYAGADPFISLASELESVRSYVYIMKIRYAEHFDLTYEIAPETQNLMVLRMGFQPIVENAILHGLSAKAGRGNLTISSWIDRHKDPAQLMIAIEDDGIGMDAKAIERAMHESANFSARGFNRIGIANVARRVRLNFGPEYGLSITSNPGAFTRVLFVLPCIERMPGQPEPESDAAPGGPA